MLRELLVLKRELAQKFDFLMIVLKNCAKLNRQQGRFVVFIAEDYMMCGFIVFQKISFSSSIVAIPPEFFMNSAIEINSFKFLDFQNEC